jgi:hypothetical protein
VSASNFARSSVNPSPKPFKCFVRLLKNILSISGITDFEWHSRFKTGRVSVGDDESSGWPSTGKTTENDEKIRELIHEDRHRIIHELVDTAEISNGICQDILTENLNMCPTAPSSQRNRKRYSTALTSTGLLKGGKKKKKNDWIAVYVPKETILKRG